MVPASASELIAQIEAQVSAGELKPGDRLASVRHAATSLNLAPNTVAAAYRRLRDRGVVTGRGRQGTVVAERPLVAPVLAHSVPAGIIDAATGNPDASLLPDLGPAMAASVGERPGRYGDPLVDATLASLAKAQFAEDGIDAKALTVVSGAMDAVERLLLAHLRPGDRVGVEDPGYASVHQVVSGLGFETVAIAIDDRGMMPDALSEAISDGLDAIIVTPRANNPSGSAFDVARATLLDSLLAEHPDVLVIQDDHAGPIAGIPFVGLTCDRRRWAVVRSVAKSLGPDLRLALVAGDRETIDRVEARLQIGPGWVSHLLQRAVVHLWSDPTTADLIKHANDLYGRRRTRLLQRLSDAGIDAHGRSGLHVWVMVPDEHAVAMALREAGYAVRAGDAYRLKSAPAIRITTASLADEVLDGIANALIDILAPRRSLTRTA